MTRICFSILASSIVFISCTSKTKVDLVVHNAVIYTVDSVFSLVEAMAIKDGKIIATGTNAQLLDEYDAAEKLDVQGKFVYPGFIDAHSHFYRYGLGLQTVDLTGTQSWNECLQRITKFVKEKNIQPGIWITGRGWDQNDWTQKEFPNKDSLDYLFKDNPLILTRIDGHAAIANQKALDIAGVKAGDKLTGGEVEVKNGKLTGILIDNAIDLVSAKIPGPDALQMKNGLLDAQKNCFAVGLTTVDDCGLDFREVQFIDDMQKKGELKMRVYAMLSDAKRNYDFLLSKGKIKTERLNVRSFKVYGDGALGSRGACLLAPYSDKPGHYGFLLSVPQHFDSVANVLYNAGFQMCTHAIGDSGNRVVLNIYAKYLKGKNDLRWRIEHAQVVNENDFKLFGENNIVPSVQPTHAISDMYWAGDRLGKQREKGAYAFNDLMKQNGWIPLGTDFPVEDIDTRKTFYAAVVRRDGKGWPDGGYQIENALTREQALRGMTIWAAKSNFEEHEKGSLEKGKYADFIILDKDLMRVEPDEIVKVNVLKTFVGGEKVFEK